ncbi:MAG: mandelate racemase/muconate lactonizing enzyme family protein [Streptosporangiales bacterium]
MRIVRITATEVAVPARPGAVESESFHRPLHSRPWRGQPAWTVQFDEMPKVVLRLELDGGPVGLGELYRGHDWANVDALADALIGRDIETLSPQALPLARVLEHDGFEMAVWDAYARSLGVRVADLLGGPVRDRVLVNAWSGPRTAEEIGDLARTFRDEGFTTVKLKGSLEDDVVAWCAAIAERAAGLRVVLDPNGRFERFAEARRIGAALADVGNVDFLEDPIPHAMVPDWQLLRGTIAVPLARHVSLAGGQLGDRSMEVVTAIRAGTADAFNFTAGLADFQRLDHAAGIAGIQCWHGSQVDLGIAEAAYVHSCAAAQSCALASDIFGRRIRSHDLLREPLAITPPYAALPAGPGLGVEIDEAALEEHRVSEREYSHR